MTTFYRLSYLSEINTTSYIGTKNAHPDRL